MSETRKLFGKMPTGQDVYEYTMRNPSGMTVKVINYGGIITSILAPDKHGKLGDVVLGFDSLDDYLGDTHYIGAIVGRHANRIAGASFTLDGLTYSLARNNGDNNHHGGLAGFNKAYWDIEPVMTSRGESLELTYLSKDGEEGFPGNLHVTVSYTLTRDNELIVDYTASTDKRTVINLTQHSYFNLSAGGQKDILSHDLQISASRFLPGNKAQVPTGELRNVMNTVFDFTRAKSIGKDIGANDEQLISGAGFDHTWVLDGSEPGLLAHACRLSDAASGRTLDILTTEPGIQVYTGNYLNGAGTGKYGEKYVYRYGIGLETQHFPNSANQPSFPSVILVPGETFHSATVYRFGNKS